MVKKVVQINTTCGVGSTGKICVEISKLLTENEIENYILYSNKSNGYELGISCSNKLYTKLQALKSRVFGNYGFNSNHETKKMIRHLERIKPDIVHLHNIHGHDCNLEMLFNYFREKKIKIFWTFHDCWSFTGYCTHFHRIKCSKWKNGCISCPLYKEYSFFIDRSFYLYTKKKKIFDGLDLTIITPSKWLSGLVKESIFKNCEIVTINNGIDLKIFSPKQTEIKNRLGINDRKRVLLGVAFSWGIGKGLDIFIELCKKLDMKKYQIILVGTNDEVDKQLPRNIISIHRTQNQIELSEIYSVSNLLINPTREDTFPTVNIESLACGTPVITFDTGGSPEIIDDTCGGVVRCDDLEGLINKIEWVCENEPYSSEACINRAKSFDKNLKYQEYLDLYNNILDNN